MFPTASELKLSDRRVYGLSGKQFVLVLTYQVGDLESETGRNCYFFE